MITAIGGEILRVTGGLRPGMGANGRLSAFPAKHARHFGQKRAANRCGCAAHHGGAGVPTAGQPPTQQATATPSTATTREGQVTMDASTYGRLVERGGYATGGMVDEPVWPAPDGGGCTVLIHPRLSAIEIDVDRSVSPEAARRYSEGLASRGWRVSVLHRAPHGEPDWHKLLLDCRR